MSVASRMQWLLLRVAALIVVGTLSGCAAVQAIHQPEKKDLGVLSLGTARTHVIAELGAPTWSDERDGDTVDVFAFKQGYTKGVKAGRALIHGAADVATFGLWEVVGIPAESLADGTDVRVEVHYNERQSVRAVEVIKGEKVFERPKLATWWEQHRRGRQKDDERAIHIGDAAEEVAIEDSPPRR